MAIERTAHPYIIRDSLIYEGEPIIEGTRTGVRHVILLFQHSYLLHLCIFYRC